MRWNLDDILPRDHFDEFIAGLAAELPRLAEHCLSPDMSPEDFRQYLALTEDIAARVSRVMSIPELMLAADTSSAEAARLKVRAESIQLQADQTLRRGMHWVLGRQMEGRRTLDDESLQRLLSAVPVMAESIRAERQGNRHLLSEGEEHVFSLKDMSGRAPLVRLREMLEVQQSYIFKPKGSRGKTLRTQAEVLSLLGSSNAPQREAAYRAMLKPYEDQLPLYFTIYQAVARDWDQESELRGHASPLSSRNAQNWLHDATVNAMLESCQSHRYLFQRYFEWKAYALGMNQLSRFDVYAPLGSDSGENVQFDNALSFVLDIFRSFSPSFAEYASRVVEKRHIDPFPRRKKSPDPFCAYVAPDVVPYVLLNYVPDALAGEETSVLAHELGHAAHFQFASHLPYSLVDNSIPLAETASTLSELLLRGRLLEDAKSEKVRLRLLAADIEDAYGVIMRQASFSLFESAAHDAFRSGTTPDELGAIYLDTQRELFGPSVALDDSLRNEWASVSHFVEQPFYVYSYAFGNLLSRALYARYRENPAFSSSIERVLAAGSSRDPEALLKEQGVDITSRTFWDSGFHQLEEQMDLLERS